MRELNNFEKRFIEENILKMGHKKMAKELKVNKNLVRKYIKKLKPGSVDMSPDHSSAVTLRRLGIAAAVIAVIVFNLIVNSNTFYRDHVNGDQRVYVGVAMKIDKFGFQEYDLRRINMVFGDTFVEYYYSQEDEKGDLLTMLEREGTMFYTTPLFVSPPVFPYLIAFSHKVFAAGKPYRAVAQRQVVVRSKDRLLAQFYSTFVPVLSSLLLVLTVFFLGKVLFSDLVGLIASFLVSMSPINLLTAQRIWADQTLSLLVVLTALVYYLALTKKSLSLLILSGVVFGLSLLTKNSAAMIMIPLALCSYIYTKKITRASADLFIFFVIAVIVALPWYMAATKAFGRPLYTPYQEGISKTIDWFQFINTRPWYTFLVNIPFQVPLYLLGYIAMIKAVLRIDRSKHYLFLSVWFLSFLALLTYGTHRTEMLGPDNRYMLPALPALALLSAQLLDSIRRFLNRKGFAYFGNIACGVSLIGCALWSLSVAFRFISRADVLIAPF